MGAGRLSHQTTAITSARTKMPTATGQNWDVGSGSGLRSIRKSSSVGFGELINNGRQQETTLSARGQLDSVHTKNGQVGPPAEFPSPDANRGGLPIHETRTNRADTRNIRAAAPRPPPE